MRFQFLLVMLTALSLAACQSNWRATSRPSTVAIGELSGTPLGYYNLCRAGNEVCRWTAGRNVERAPNGSVKLTEELRAQIDQVNRSVNRSIRPVTDSQSVGKRDSWAVYPSSGDCEDFALTKKSLLLRAGLPSSALLLAIVTRRAGEEHAVLVVRTAEGDFVLDNMTSRILSWRQSNYRGKKIQAPDDQWRWRQVM